MNSYRALKAKEVELALAALQERLEQCPRANGQHVIVLDRLEALLATFANELLAIQPVIHDAAFRSLVDYTLNRTSIFLFIVEMQYLRGLVTPSSEELFLRSVFLNCAKRLKLDWIEDVAVLYVPHASGGQETRREQSHPPERTQAPTEALAPAGDGAVEDDVPF
jgi:hypothetical protein